MNDILKAVFCGVAAWIVIKALEAEQTGEAFSLAGALGSIPVLGQVMSPPMDPLPDTTASYSGYSEISMAEALSAIDANPNLVADLTPQGQFRIDTRATG